MQYPLFFCYKFNVRLQIQQAIFDLETKRLQFSILY